jgi:limonene-1,2-epoxide hydrolase
MKRVQRILAFVLALVLIGGCSTSQERALKKKEKGLKAEIEKKAIKLAQKEARKFKKQGFEVTPGSLPMEKMLEATWMKLLEKDSEGNPIYIAADGNAVAQTRTAAEMQALEVAKLNLAGQLETIIRSIVEANIGNAQLNNEEAASVTKVLQGAKNIIATTLEQVDPAFKIYRNLPNKNVEVNIKLLYNRRQSVETAKKAIKQEMEKDLEKIQHKLDKLLGLDVQ